MNRVRQELANFTWQDFATLVLIPLVGASPFLWACLLTGN